MGDELPIYRYTVILTDGQDLSADAMSYREDGPWLIFDDPVGSVLTIRVTAVAMIKRGEQVASVSVESL